MFSPVTAMDVQLSLRQAVLSLSDSPRPDATWASSLRRGVVVAAFLIVGFSTDHMEWAAPAAFGAFQIGLFETVRPFWKLAGSMVVVLAVTALAVFGAILVGDTWWTVPWLALWAIASGFLTGTRQIIGMAAFFGLILATVFAGQPGSWDAAVTTTVWLTIGGFTQVLLWLAAWPWNRRSRVSRLLANDVDSVSRLTVNSEALGEGLAASARAQEAIDSNLDSARLPPELREQVLDVEAWTALVRRTVVAWLVAADPPLSERIAVNRALREIRQLLEGHRRSVPSGDVLAGVDVASAYVTAAVSGLRAAAVAWREQPLIPKSLKRGAIFSTEISDLRGRIRHAIRLTVAICVAQTISLLWDNPMSYWITLTIVFVVKPDWSFTLIRSLLRVLGNVGAVILVGAIVIWAIANPPVFVLLAFLFAALSFQWFSGNYGLEAFAIAGFIVLMDSLLNPGEDVAADRAWFTVIGAALGLLVSVLIPTWRSSDVPDAMARVATTLTDTLAMQSRKDAISDPRILSQWYAITHAARDALDQLRVVAIATALEPRPRPVRTAPLLDMANRGERVLTYLWTVSSYQLASQRGRTPPPLSESTADGALRELRRMEQSLSAGDAAPPPTTDLTDRMAQLAQHVFGELDSSAGPEELHRVHLIDGAIEQEVLRLVDSALDVNRDRPGASQTG